MPMKKLLSMLLLLMIYVINSNAQTVISGSRDYRDILFAQSVKSCDEFMCRFNEEEYFPDLKKEDPQIGQKNFLFLFDYLLAQDKDKNVFMKDIVSFYDTVSKNHVKLKYDSKNWYAELRAKFTYKKQCIELGIMLHPQTTTKGLECWSIIGVNGMEKLGFSNTEERFAISPEQHESEFMEIEGDFKTYSKKFSKYRGIQTELNSLSYFFALIESGTLIFENRQYVVYHFFDVPDYYFKVKYHNRKKANNGWLISDFKRVTKEENDSIKHKILGI